MAIRSKMADQMLGPNPSQFDLATAGIQPFPLSEMDVEFYPKVLKSIGKILRASERAGAAGEKGGAGTLDNLYRLLKGYKEAVHGDLGSEDFISGKSDLIRRPASAGEPTEEELRNLPEDSRGGRDKYWKPHETAPGTKVSPTGTFQPTPGGDWYKTNYTRELLQKLLDAVEEKTGGGAAAAGAAGLASSQQSGKGQPGHPLLSALRSYFEGGPQATPSATPTPDDTPDPRLHFNQMQMGHNARPSVDATPPGGMPKGWTKDDMKDVPQWVIPPPSGPPQDVYMNMAPGLTPDMTREQRLAQAKKKQQDYARRRPLAGIKQYRDFLRDPSREDWPGLYYDRRRAFEENALTDLQNQARQVGPTETNSPPFKAAERQKQNLQNQDVNQAMRELGALLGKYNL